MDHDTTVGLLPNSSHSRVAPPLAGAQPLLLSAWPTRYLWKQGLTVAAFQVHEGQVWKDYIWLHARMPNPSQVYMHIYTLNNYLGANTLMYDYSCLTTWQLLHTWRGRSLFDFTTTYTLRCMYACMYVCNTMIIHCNCLLSQFFLSALQVIWN